MKHTKKKKFNKKIKGGMLRSARSALGMSTLRDIMIDKWLHINNIFKNTEDWLDRGTQQSYIKNYYGDQSINQLIMQKIINPTHIDIHNSKPELISEVHRLLEKEYDIYNEIFSRQRVIKCLIYDFQVEHNINNRLNIIYLKWLNIFNIINSTEPEPPELITNETILDEAQEEERFAPQLIIGENIDELPKAKAIIIPNARLIKSTNTILSGAGLTSGSNMLKILSIFMIIVYITYYLIKIDNYIDYI